MAPNKVGKKGKQNGNAGNHPSYIKLGMSKEAIARRIAYDKERQNTPERIAYRVELNRKRREAIKKGTAKVGDGKDISHKVAFARGGSIKGAYLEKASRNRSRGGKMNKK